MATKPKRTTRGGRGKPRSERWAEPELAPLGSDEERHLARAELQCAARRLFLGERAPAGEARTVHYSFGHELSSPADLALAVVQTLMMIWEGDGPTRSDVRRMKAALDALGVLDTSEPSLEERRSLAVRAIVRMAEQYKRAPSRDVLGKLWVLLQVQDDAFGELATWEADSQEEWYAELGARLERYDPNPRGKKGAIGAETILAKIIVEHCDASGALGLRCKPDEDTEDAVERIRKVLASEAGDYLDALETSEKQP